MGKRKYQSVRLVLSMKSYESKQGKKMSISVCNGCKVPKLKNRRKLKRVCRINGFMNVGRRVASSYDNFLIFGANCDESSPVVKKYVRFNGKDSCSSCHNFMTLNKCLSHESDSKKEHQTVLVFDITLDQIAQLSNASREYFNLNALFMYTSVNPTFWTMGHIVPAHCRQTSPDDDKCMFWGDPVMTLIDKSVKEGKVYPKLIN
ncbi:hypothetical protein P5673_018463 [Acropora cervicornis]|uniref:Uncharacterized protein n=1 Tax=Acropora cervicornis TaxID=6130 RepID=A0AAD9QCH3_ACRCE|nr:hypothetical protein P5673_018463 [Acropora cervicornis]